MLAHALAMGLLFSSYAVVSTVRFVLISYKRAVSITTQGTNTYRYTERYIYRERYIRIDNRIYIYNI